MFNELTLFDHLTAVGSLTFLTQVMGIRYNEKSLYSIY